MLYSMTGFGSARGPIIIGKSEKVTLIVELKALNSRFFEVVCRLPSALNSLELDIISILKKKLIRGRVYLNVTILGNEAPFETVQPNLEIINKYLMAADKVKKDFNVHGNLTISELLSLPNVFISEKKNISVVAQKSILKLVDKAADKLLLARSTEGKNLLKDLDKFLFVSSEKIKKIKISFRKTMHEKREEIKKILKQTEKGDDEAKLKLDELYSTINKIDINEEITRLDSHLKTSQKLLKDKNVIKGKRFDFILQELMREVNTISAKSMSYDISTLVVDVKVELEKVREQVQNIV